MAGICYTTSHKRGALYAIECVKNGIISKESKGKDASFERILLEEWSSYEGYEGAKEVLAQLSRRGKQGVTPLI